MTTITQNCMKLISVLLGLGLNITAHAELGFGSCNYGHQVVSSITCLGTAHLNGTTVTDTLKVSGPLVAEHAEIQNLYVKGPVMLTQSTIKGIAKVAGNLVVNQSHFQNKVMVVGNTHIYRSTIQKEGDFIGPLVLQDSHLADNLNVIADQLIIDHSTIRGVVSVQSHPQAPKVYLYHHSVLSAKLIQFSGQPGIVFDSDHSNHSQLALKNGAFHP